MADTNGKLAEVIADLARKVADLQQQIDVLTQMIDSIQAENAEMFNNLTILYNDIADTRSVTTTTPPTADGTGLPGFVVLDTKPETEYKNYVYIYPKE